MGMSTHIIGFKPPDEKWRQMKAVWDAVDAAKVDIPKMVYDYFEGSPPDVAGVEVELEGNAAQEWHDEYRSGFEVDLSKLPDGVKTIRFYNSW